MRALVKRFERFVQRRLLSLGYEVKSVPQQVNSSIPDARYYRPLFSPWDGYGDFRSFLNVADPHTTVSRDRLYILYALATHALHLEGEFWECGVYKGGTACMLAELIRQRSRRGTTLRLFDTFTGMPENAREIDMHKAGDFSETSLASVMKVVGNEHWVNFHKGLMPGTFVGKERSRIAFSHIDVDIYQSVKDCCEFIYPRLVEGGICVFDDYGLPSCPGARKAVDEFFRDRGEKPIVLPTSQAFAIKLPTETSVRVA
jgi:O-methyltransferase